MDSKNIKKNQKNKVVLSEPETLKKAIKTAIGKHDYRVMENCLEIIEENYSILEYFEEEEKQGVKTIENLLKLKKNKKDSEEDKEEEENEENTVSQKNMHADFEALIQETYSKTIHPFPLFVKLYNQRRRINPKVMTLLKQ